jgi:hypothetical protein
VVLLGFKKWLNLISFVPENCVYRCFEFEYELIVFLKKCAAKFKFSEVSSEGKYYATGFGFCFGKISGLF